MTSQPRGRKITLTQEMQDMLSEPLGVLGLQTRTLVMLAGSDTVKGAGIETVGQLLGTRKEELLEIKNFGDKCLDDVIARLAYYGFC